MSKKWFQAKWLKSKGWLLGVTMLAAVAATVDLRSSGGGALPLAAGSVMCAIFGFYVNEATSAQSWRKLSDEWRDLYYQSENLRERMRKRFGWEGPS